MTLADRVSQLEAVVTAWEERRRRLIPKELEDHPNVQMVIKDCLQNYFTKMQDFAGQRRLDEATTEQNRLREEARYQLERKHRMEMAELIEAINFYERNGFSPPGYEFTERVEE